MTTITLTSAPEVKAVMLTAFPGYRKQTVTLSVFNGGVTLNSYWDGGTRSEFAVVELATLKRKSLPTATHPYFDVAARGLAQVENQDITIDRVGKITLKHLPEGFALVEAGTFCGKAATGHIHLHPANMAKLLPQGDW